jgi:inhibitor of cysteine peptidase
MTSPSLTLTELDDGRTVEVHLGDAVELRLYENASTGYRWSFEEPEDSRLSVSGGERREEKGAVGSGGTVRWRLRPKAAGTVPVRLRLWRRWEGEGSIQKRFAATLVVRP